MTPPAAVQRALAEFEKAFAEWKNGGGVGSELSAAEEISTALRKKLPFAVVTLEHAKSQLKVAERRNDFDGCITWATLADQANEYWQTFQDPSLRPKQPNSIELPPEDNINYNERIVVESDEEEEEETDDDDDEEEDLRTTKRKKRKSRSFSKDDEGRKRRSSKDNDKPKKNSREERAQRKAEAKADSSPPIVKVANKHSSSSSSTKQHPEVICTLAEAYKSQGEPIPHLQVWENLHITRVSFADRDRRGKNFQSRMIVGQVALRCGYCAGTPESNNSSLTIPKTLAKFSDTCMQQIKSHHWKKMACPHTPPDLHKSWQHTLDIARQMKSVLQEYGFYECEFEGGIPGIEFDERKKKNKS